MGRGLRGCAHGRRRAARTHAAAAGGPREARAVLSPRRVLVLGGTAEGRELATALAALGVDVLTSLAGRTSRPGPVAGRVRVGGLGGAAGLAALLREEAIMAVVDATHPFARTISASAVRACTAEGVPLVRLERPGWVATDRDAWTWAASLEDAADRIDRLGSRVLLTTGRQGLGAFAGVRAWVLVRCVTAPDPPLPASSRVLLDRGPFTLDGELALLERHAIDLVVTKDSGGDATRAKLDAARQLAIPVLLVGRGPQPVGGAVASVADAVAWAMMRG